MGYKEPLNFFWTLPKINPWTDWWVLIKHFHRSVGGKLILVPRFWEKPPDLLVITIPQLGESESFLPSSDFKNILKSCAYSLLNECFALITKNCPLIFTITLSLQKYKCRQWVITSHSLGSVVLNKNIFSLKNQLVF